MTPTETPQDQLKQSVSLNGAIVRFLRVTALWIFSGVTFLVICVGLLVILAFGQTLRAPDWVRDRVENYLSLNLVGSQVELDSVALALSESWTPSVELIDVAFTNAEDQFIFSLEKVNIGLTLSALLAGDINLTYIDSSQAVIDFDQVVKSGSSFGSTTPFWQEWKINNIQQLGKSVDDLFALEQFSSLETITIQSLKLSHDTDSSGRLWSLDNARLQLSRNAENLSLIGYIPILIEQNPIFAIEVNVSSRIGDVSAEFGVDFNDIPVNEVADAVPVFSGLKPLQASLSGALHGRLNGNGEFTNVSAELRLGPGSFQSAEYSRTMTFESMNAYVDIDPQRRFIRINEFRMASEWFTGTLNGDVWQVETTDGFLQSFVGQIDFAEATISHQSFFNEAIRLDQASVDFKVTMSPFSLTIGQFVFVEQGSLWKISGEIKQEADGWHVNLDGHSDEITVSAAKAFWPQNILSNSRSWIMKNIQRGLLSDVNVAVRLSPTHPPNFYAGFAFTDADIQFLPTMPAIHSAGGHVRFMGKRLSVTATSGRMIAEQGGAINIAGTSFIVPDTSLGIGAPAVVQAQGRGNLTAVLSILNQKPIEIFKQTDLSISSISGLAHFAGEIKFPLRPNVQFNEISFDMSGDVTEVKSNELVPQKLLTAPRLKINATNSIVEVTGSGTLADVPFQAKWHKQLGQENSGSQLTGTLDLSEETLTSFGINVPAGTLNGSGNASFSVFLTPEKVPNLMLSSDLVGIGIVLSDLGWSKPADVEAQFELAAQLGESIVVDKFQFVAPGLSSSVKIDSLNADAGITAEFDHIRIEDWLDISAVLTVDQGQISELTVLGGRIDLRRVPLAESEQQSNPFAGAQIVINKLDQLQVTKQIILTDLSGDFQGYNGLTGQLQGLVGGEAPITGQINRENGQSSLHIQSQDAGAVLRTAKLLPNSTGGSLDLRLRSTAKMRNFTGRISVNDISVQDTPVILALLNAISVVGLFSELSGQGIVFSDVEARFDLSPTELTLLESRAIGPSIGLTMEGTYALLQKSLEVHGVITPVYLLNQIGGLVSPREGEGLFGFNYRLNGAVDSPQVSVNLLSGLAPGFLRELFRLGG